MGHQNQRGLTSCQCSRTHMYVGIYSERTLKLELVTVHERLIKIKLYENSW